MTTRKLLIFAMPCLLAACGELEDAAKEQGTSDARRTTLPPGIDCVEAIPADVQQEMALLAQETAAAKAAAIQAEQQRLGVKPVVASHIVFDSYLSAQPADPFPEATTPDAPAADKLGRNARYGLFHGREGESSAYETKAGSNVFFIVDLARGDGLGTSNPMMLHTEAPLAGLGHLHSWHSWQVTDDNRLIRARLKPVREVVRTVRLCDCDPAAKRVADGAAGAPASDASVAAPQDIEAVFTLPGTVPPRLLEAVFEATYTERVVDVQSVPVPGRACRPTGPGPNVAC